jgi:hypothetical protein
MLALWCVERALMPIGSLTRRRAKAFLDQPHQIAPDTASTAPASASRAVNRRRGQ